MDNKLKIITCEVGKIAKVDWVENKLEKLQEKVKGCIEFFDLDNETTIICNDEGKINGMGLNRSIRDNDNKIIDIIGGDFIIVGMKNNGDLKSLDEKQIEKLIDKYKFPEQFFMDNGEIFSIIYEPKVNKKSTIER